MYEFLSIGIKGYVIVLEQIKQFVLHFPLYEMEQIYYS